MRGLRRSLLALFGIAAISVGLVAVMSAGGSGSSATPAVSWRGLVGDPRVAGAAGGPRRRPAGARRREPALHRRLEHAVGRAAAREGQVRDRGAGAFVD